jgi:type IV pilus assembly protein PilB
MTAATRAPAGGVGFLGDILVRHGVLTPDRLEAALSEQKGRGGRLGAVLVDAGFCTEEQIAKALAAQFRIPFVAFSPREADLAAARTLGLDFLRKHALVPLKAREKICRLAVSDPLDVEPVDRAQALLAVPIETVVALRRDVLTALDFAARAEAEQGGAVVATDAAEDVSSTLDEIILRGVRSRASDIHFEPEEKAFRVRYRIDGVLRQGGSYPKAAAPQIVARIKVLGGLDLCERRLPQDGRVRFQAPSGMVDLRVSVLPTIYGEGCVLRVLDKTRAVVSPQKLAVAPRILDPLLELVQRPHGLVLATGPTGSGKTTTLYSLLSTVDAMERKVVTVEDPVEYEFPMVRQVQVQADAGLTFAAALRAILRHDPEVILIGEIRDRETAEIATRAALTGHLVLSTLHTNSSVGAIPRLIDMGVDPFLVSATLIGVLGQRLTRRLCPECSLPDPHAPEERELLPAELKDRDDLRRTPRGCDLCGKSGFAGRIGLHELLIPDARIRRLVAERAGEDDLLSASVDAGFRSMAFDGAEKILAGRTTRIEVEKVVR